MALPLLELSYVLLYVYINNSVLMMNKTLELTKPLPRNQLSASAIKDSLAMKGMWPILLSWGEVW